MTAELEAKLLLAVGAQVMLRSNIDTNASLVNCAIGTVVSVRPNHVTVQFDHTNTLYNVEKVKSYYHEKLLHLQEAVSTDVSICCDNPQVPRLVVRLGHSGPLRQGV